MSTNIPEATIKHDRVRASIWRNVRTRKDGTPFVAWQINVERRYQDKDGNWKSTNSYDLRDLDSVLAAITEARGFIFESEQKEVAPQVPAAASK